MLGRVPLLNLGFTGLKKVATLFGLTVCVLWFAVFGSYRALGASGSSDRAPAGWVAVARAGNEVTYIHKGSIKKVEPFIRVWMLQDIDFTVDVNESKRVLQRSGVKSQKILWEFDCQGRFYRMRALVQFSEPLGAGSVVFSNNNFSGPWGNTPPDSVGGIVFDLICPAT